MINRLLLIALLGVFVLSCKTKHTVTYGSTNRTTEVQTKRKVAPQNKEEGGPYALPDDNGKFMIYEINSVDAYIDFFSETAQLEMKAYGIPASITLAQGLLESGLGKGELALKTNNHFGIKCHTGWTGDYVLHDDDEADECFRKYNHPMYSYRDHSMFLSTRSRYASLFDLNKDDYKGWAKGLQKAGYATDRKYPEKLISLIERYDLQQFDAIEVDGSVMKKEDVSVVPETSDPKEEEENISWVPEKTEDAKPTNDVENKKDEDPSKKEVATDPVRDSDTSIHTVVRGDSLWALSRKFGVTVSQLRQWNSLSTNDLSIGQQLVVKKN